MERYRHNQTAWVTLGMCVVMTVFFYGIHKLAAGGGSTNNFVITVAIMALVAILFFRMETRVTDEALTLRLGIGLLRKTVRMDAIASVTRVLIPWHSIGIKIIHGGWIWSASGRKALELRLANGRRLVVGTDDPDGLYRALGKPETVFEEE
jgi:hypothetical protein